MSQENDRSLILNLLAGIGIGALVGAVAGILLAPRSGAESREKLNETLQGLGGRLNDLSEDVSTRVRSAVKAGRAAARDIGATGAEEGGDRMGG